MINNIIEHYTEPEYQIDDGKSSIIGTTENMLDLFNKVNKLLRTDTTILITGETGTGKGLIAKALHHNDFRKDNYLCSINCAGIPRELLESELFGHMKGSFTGATSTKIGKFAYAHRGTVFLNEIADMPMDLQAKILTVLEEKEFTPIGANGTIKSDVRVIAATNKNLEEAIEKGEFREDLYYRLNVFPLIVPPLRDHKEDIRYLVEYNVKKLNENPMYENRFKSVNSNAVYKLMEHKWNGNIRDLENVIERSFILHEGNIIGPDNIHFSKNSENESKMSSFFSVTMKRWKQKNSIYREINMEIEEAKLKDIESAIPTIQIKDDSASEESIVEKPWYEEGILPVKIRNIANMLKITRNVLRQRFEKTFVELEDENKIFYQNIKYRKSGSSVYLLYLTHPTYSLIIMNSESIQKRLLENAILKSGFTKLIKSPIAPFSSHEMKLYSGRDSNWLEDVAIREKIMMLEGNPVIYFVKPEELKYFEAKNTKVCDITKLKSVLQARYINLITRNFPTSPKASSTKIQNYEFKLLHLSTQCLGY